MTRCVRHEQIERQWQILLRLSYARCGATLRELQEASVDLGGSPVSERTIRRDLEALGGAGFLIDHTRADGVSRWSLAEAGTVRRLESQYRARTAVQASHEDGIMVETGIDAGTAPASLGRRTNLLFQSSEAHR